MSGRVRSGRVGARRRASGLGLVALLGAAASAVGSAAGQASGPVTIARLEYDGGGDWYANPSSLPNLLAAVRERTGIPMARQEAVARLADASLADYPLLYMTGHGAVRFSVEDRAALREHLLAGGFLHADDNYGMDESFRREIALAFPDKRLVELPPTHPIFGSFYEFPDGLPKIHEHDGAPPQAFGLFHQGRLALLYTYESDLGDGWEDVDAHGDSEEVRESALRMGVNVVVFVLAQAARAS